MKESIQLFILGSVLYIVFYLVMLTTQHLSGYCDNKGGDFWAGGCHQWDTYDKETNSIRIYYR